MSIARQKFCYLVVLNKKFLTQLASDLIPQIEQVLSQNGIIMQQGFYKARLKNLHGIEVITPHAGQQNTFMRSFIKSFAKVKSKPAPETSI